MKKLGRVLSKEFGTKVTASEERGCLVLRGELERWDDVVRAGQLAVDRKKYLGVVNEIVCTGDAAPPTRLPELRDKALEGAAPDVLVVGAGIVGCTIARELTKYALSVVLVDKEHDVAMHASSRNDGMVHPGVDLHKGTLKYEYNMRGNRLYDELCRDLDVPFKRVGQYLCFTNPLLRPIAHGAVPVFTAKGIPGVHVANRAELRAVEPNLDPAIRYAIAFPNSGIVSPYNLTIACAESAIVNGATVSLDTAVLGMTVEDGRITAVETNRGALHPRVVVNAAGVFSEDVAAMAHDRFFSIHPRRGTNSILDSKYHDRLVHTIAANLGASDTRHSHTKGGGIVSTVDGNTLIGPTAHETRSKEDFSTDRADIQATFQKHKVTAPISESQIITYFTGVRAATYEEDFVVRKGVFTENIVHAAGIQSPGLTAAPAIAEDVARLAAELAGKTEQNPDFIPQLEAVARVKELSPEARNAWIVQNPDYGEILCRCEEVSRGEILAAMRRPLPCDTVDGIKRRVRPGMGRCQGGFCGPLVAQVIAQEKGIPLSAVQKSGAGSNQLLGETKGVQSK